MLRPYPIGWLMIGEARHEYRPETEHHEVDEPREL